jgi:adenine-specific DNA-methyltransferase
MVDSDLHTNLTIEETYNGIVSEGHRKKYAQFFTPIDIAEFMISWILRINPATILEPAFGLGIFSRQILSYNEYKSTPIIGYEIDQLMYDWAKGLFSQYPNVQLINDDYMFNDWDRKYDGIVCNPPYLKFHDYINIDVVNEVEFHSGVHFRKTSNLYTMFLVKSIMQMTEGGRASYIVPTEFLNSDYGTIVKKFLIESKVLRYVFVVDFNCMAFAKTLTTSTILLLQNDTNTDTVAMISVSDPDELKEYQTEIDTNTYSSNMLCFKHKDLDPRAKWSVYYRPPAVTVSSRLVPFMLFATVKRGIATGDNDYFTFNRTKAVENGIPQSCLIPCIGKAQDVVSQVFTGEDFKQLLSRDKKVYLLDATQEANSSIDAYLKLGLSLGVNRKYLTSKRSPWYSLENRPPSDLWIGVFNRQKPRFVLNDALVRNLTTFHCVYLNKLIDKDRTLFIAYLLSDVSIFMLESCKREYGNGLSKLEPNDINKSLMPDIFGMSDATKQHINRLFAKYLTVARNNEPDVTIMEQISNIIYDTFKIVRFSQ